VESRKLDIKYTYDDYYQWDDGDRWELIDGVPYMMSPAPSSTHQRISMNLSTAFSVYLQGKKCEVFAAPFDVRLNSEGADNTVVQPDISIICDPEKTKDDQGCKGAPDLIVEILSPSTAKMDRIVKFKLYEKAKVKEYWIVDPFHNMVEVFTLKGESYQSQLYAAEDIISVGIFDSLEVDLGTIFENNIA